MDTLLFEQTDHHQSLGTTSAAQYGVSDIRQDTLFEDKQMFEYWLHRHYDVRSEAFTGADALMTLLDLGWDPGDPVVRQSLPMRGGCSHCYHFQMTRTGSDGYCRDAFDPTGPKTLTLCIVYNPAIDRIITHLGLRVCHDEALSDHMRAQLLPQTRAALLRNEG